MTPELRIAAIQSDLHWESPGANMAMFEEKIWQIDGQVDLIVLPEMFTTGFSMNVNTLAEAVGTTTFRWMKQISQQTDGSVMGSYMVKEKGRFYNRLYCVHPNGSANHYDKRHLFGMGGESKDFSSGDQRLTFSVKGWRIRPMICYDLRFPVWARSRRTTDDLFEYDALVYVANWPKPRINAWDTLLAARAIENIAYSIGVNRIGLDQNGLEYVGHSSAYDFMGKRMIITDKEEVIQVSLLKDDLLKFREQFPFQKDSDQFTIE
ncbi:MAG: nitrilase family protein [Cyclobacteriaceae bacterium]